jgi:hypothetical protein
MRRSILILSFLVPAVAGSGLAQTVPTIVPGARIRFALPPGTPVVLGTAIEARQDTLLVRREESGDTVALPLSQLVRLDISGGTQTHALRGAGIGFLAGAIVGAIAGQSSDRKCSSSMESSGWLTCGQNAGYGAIGLGVLGAGIGAIVGWVNPTERWQPVALPGNPAIAVQVWHGIRRLGVQLTWKSSAF